MSFEAGPKAIDPNGREHQIQAGQRVRVIGGAFVGLVGVVLASCSQGRLVISVAANPSGVRIEIDRPFVELEHCCS